MIDRKAFSNISASTAAFTLRGGNYAIQVTATWGGGSVKLQRLSLDGTTYTSVSTTSTDFTADGFATVNLPNGTYKLIIATASAIYAEIVSVVTTI